MKIFVTGGSGMFGQFLNIEINKKHELLTQFNNNPGNCTRFNNVKMNLTDYEKLESVFKEYKPDVVIHTAAYSNPERSDAAAADAVYEVNVNSSHVIAEMCDKYDAKMIYTSTDSVYAGYRGSYLKEDSKLVPISLYAETKLMGEVKIRETFEKYLIARVPLQIGLCLGGTLNNFHKLFNNLKEGKTTKLFTDQYRTPLALHETARIIAELAEKNVNGETINIASDERVSRFELGELLCDITGHDKKLLIPLTMDEGNALYKVADVSMNNDKMKSFGVYPKPVKQMIEESLRFINE